MVDENKSSTPKEIRDKWRTPQWLFNYFDRFHHFKLDVAAEDGNALCSAYYTEEENGLIQPWTSSNWCNPPYSNIMPWVEKAIEEQKKDNHTVLLLPADPSVKWFRRAWEHAQRVTFISGRVSFINAETDKPVNGNNKGSVVMYLGDPYLSGSRFVELIDRDLHKGLLEG